MHQENQPADSTLGQASPTNQQPAVPSTQPGSGTVSIPTVLATALANAGDNPHLDAHAKKLLSFKPVVAMILRDCTEEFKGFSLETIINECLKDSPTSQGQSGGLLNGNDRVLLLQQEFINENGVKVYLDNFFRAYRPGQEQEMIPVNIDIEPQNDSNPGYPLPRRGQVYCSFMIVNDLVRKTPNNSSTATQGTQENAQPVRSHLDAYDYNQVHKALSIWICMNPKVADRNTIVRYRTERKVYAAPANNNAQAKPAKEPKEEPRANYDLAEVIIVNLGTGQPDNGPGVAEAVSMLNVLLKGTMSVEEKKTVLQKTYKIAMSDEFAQEVDDLSGLALAIANDAVNQGYGAGFGAGFSQGMNQGVSQGAHENAVETAKIMIGDREPVNKIAKFTRLDRNTLESLAAEMGETLQEA